MGSGTAEDGWRLRHLPILLASCAATAVVATIAAWAVAGPASAVGMPIGMAVSVGSFTVTTVLLAHLDRVARHLIMPFGMTLYATKFTLFAVLMHAVARTEWPGLPALAIGIVVGAFAWIGTHIAWLQTRRGRPRL
ncbi:hypothetical protein GCM10010123_11270 [Pilimelia anulata]|uniref:ATP synthase protein I n=1 Tax=Pilimelia anulata TaxID=53371 RepID=A0A8J3F857_9ACTN|nr:hypothetical protein [Pilimelia anulata]GGJ83400.1 hypothetical protein GCM10010123_11270 [Pilimelia anulata]